MSDKQELIQALIRLVIERADKSKGNFGRGYFLLNIQHPVVLDLYSGGMLREIAAWCQWRQEEMEKSERLNEY